MKKVTFIFTLLITSIGFSQTTLGLYTERAVTNSQALNTDFGNNANANNSFPTGGTDAGTDGGTEVYEVAAIADGLNTQWILNYNPRADFTPFSFYYISLKSNSAQPTKLRIQDASDVSATLDPASYGMVYDGNWHTLAVPLADFTAAAPTIDLSLIKNVFIVKTDPAAPGDVVASTYKFFIDDIYLSTSVTLSTNNIDVEDYNVYPNPVYSTLSISSGKDIEHVEIYDITGKKVLESNITKDLDVSSLNSGVYFINSIVNGANVTSKFIKK